MKKKKNRKKSKYISRYRQPEAPNKLNIKIFIILCLLLGILLMKKYDLALGDFNVDSIYQVVYHNEDLNLIKDKLFFFKSDSNESQTLDNLDESEGAIE